MLKKYLVIGFSIVVATLAANFAMAYTVKDAPGDQSIHVELINNSNQTATVRLEVVLTQTPLYQIAANSSKPIAFNPFTSGNVTAEMFSPVAHICGGAAPPYNFKKLNLQLTINKDLTCTLQVA